MNTNLIKDVKNAGIAAQVGGWAVIIINISRVLFGNEIFDFPETDIWGIIVALLIGLIFIFLGRKIKSLKDYNLKGYIQILIALSIIFFTIIFATGGKIGLILPIVLIYLIFGLISINKLLKSQEFVQELISEKSLFKNLVDFSYNRTYKDASFFYISYFIVIIILGTFFASIAILITGLNDFNVGLKIGEITAVIVAIILTFFIVKNRNLKNSYLVLVLISGILAYLGGAILGLLPASFILTREVNK